MTYNGIRYEDFETATGCGTGEGLCGWNCRHNFYPCYPGTSERNYTDQRLEELADPQTYEESRRRRALERRVRDAKRRYLAAEAAGADTGRAAARLKNARSALAQFLRDKGLRQDGSRERVQGFGRSEAAKATWAVKKEDAEVAKVNDVVVQGHTLFDVTNKAIEMVPKPFFRSLSNNMNLQAQEHARNILRSVQNMKVGTESTISFSLDGKEVVSACGTVGDMRVRVQNLATPYISLHNHASNDILSPEDIRTLIKYENMRGIGAVGNNGSFFTCEKVFGYDKKKAARWFSFLESKYPQYKGGESLDEAIRQRTAFANELQRDGVKYGFLFSG